MFTHDFARDYLFNPLGFATTTWRMGEGAYNIGSTTLKVTPRDMLKFGTLYLNEGVYGDQQIISADWVRVSTRAHISTQNAIPYGSQYGFQWWVSNVDEHDLFFANGYGGQFIVVVPELKVVVVTTADWRYSDQTAGQYWYEIIQVIMEDILPAFHN